jgi:hypothetical protein
MGHAIPHWPQLSTSLEVSLQPVGQLVWPVGQVAQSVPAVLQVPLGHVIVAATHIPVALHAAGAVTTPPVHDWPAPHNVPEPLLVVSVQTIVPVEHVVIPFLHGLAGWHAWPAVQDTQAPARQTRFVPQAVPSGWFAPLSVQTGLPVEQLSVPTWHGLAGGHAVPAVQATQVPLAQTMFAPHMVPFGRLPDSWQTGDPVAQDVVPVLQTLVGWQLAPDAHDTHAPALQTRSVPHCTPLVSDWPVSLHAMLGEQTVTPAWHGLAGTQLVPAAQAAQLPPVQTMLVPHTVPLGASEDSMQTGAPVLQAMVPRRQGFPATVQVAPAMHAPHVPVALQTMSVPQAVPAGTLLPLSLQTGAPPEQLNVPL